MPIEKLLKVLGDTPSGRISKSDLVVEALANAWTCLDGHSAEGMQGEKLYGRMEEIDWNPPRAIVQDRAAWRHAIWVVTGVHSSLVGRSFGLYSDLLMC